MHLLVEVDQLLERVVDLVGPRRPGESHPAERKCGGYQARFGHERLYFFAAAAAAPLSPADMTLTRKSIAGLSESWVVMFPFSYPTTVMLVLFDSPATKVWLDLTLNL